jgi:hypothetical protein
MMAASPPADKAGQCSSSCARGVCFTSPAGAAEFRDPGEDRLALGDRGIAALLQFDDARRSAAGLVQLLVDGPSRVRLLRVDPVQLCQRLLPTAWLAS